MPIATIRSIDDAGIAYQWFTERGATRHEGVLKWGSIVSVIAFKRDIFSDDLICLGITDDDDLAVEFDEEDPNWDLLVKTLPESLPGAIAWSDWFQEVAFPAFELGERTIFQRESPPDETS